MTGALERAAASDANLRVWMLAIIAAVALVGLAVTLLLIARERRQPAGVRGSARAAMYQSKVTRDLTSSVARVIGEAKSKRIVSSPTRHRSRVTRHRRQPSLLAAFLGGLVLRLGGRPRRHPVRWVDPTPATHTPPPVADPTHEPTAANPVNSPTQPLPINGTYRPVTATGRAPMPPPPPWQSPAVSVLTDFERAGIPADALTAALEMEPALREWAQSRAGDPEATKLLHRIGPDDGRMVSESDRWPQ